MFRKLAGFNPTKPKKTAAKFLFKETLDLEELKDQARGAAKNDKSKKFIAHWSQLVDDAWDELSFDEKDRWEQESITKHEEEMEAWKREKDASPSQKAEDKQKYVLLTRFL